MSCAASTKIDHREEAVPGTAQTSICPDCAALCPGPSPITSWRSSSRRATSFVVDSVTRLVTLVADGERGAFGTREIAVDVSTTGH